MDRCGQSVAISNQYCLVGAPDEDGAGVNEGAAYLFDLATGAELFKLSSSDKSDEDNFGYGVGFAATFHE